MRAAAWALAVLWAGWAPPAHAYLPPAEELMRRWALSPASSLRDATLSLSRLEDEAPPAAERLLLKRPERLRWQRGSAAAPGPTWLVREGACVVLTPERHEAPAPQAAGCAPLWARFLQPGGGRKPEDQQARLMQLLEEAKIDTKVVSLGRIEQTPVYIVGARPHEPKRPQLWLEKDTLVPRRTFLANAVEGEEVWLDLRLDGWKRIGARWLPGQIERHAGDRVVTTWRVLEASVDSGLPEKLFSWGPRRAR